ncbi:TonB-dependent receptor domain-containing protein [candidate division KSB1 bacterium]
MNRRMYILTVVIFIIVYASPVLSQPAVLKGQVTDHASGEPLIGANIVLISPESGAQVYGAASGQDGIYEVTNIRAGSYIVQISYVGYESRRFEDISLSSGQTLELDVTLIPTVLEAEPVEVSAFRRSINLLESASISIIDTTQLQSIRPLTPTEHITGLAGVDVAKTGIGQSSVAIRGFNDLFSGSMLLLVDNRIGRVPSIRFNAYNFIPTSNEDIERIEIVRGPVSALYGPNSANGVMHIVTKSPFGSEGYVVNFGFGQNRIVSTDFRFAGSRNNKIGYKITGSYMQGEDFESRDAYEDSIRVRLIESGSTISGEFIPDNPDAYNIGVRDFLFEKLAATAQLNYRLNDDVGFVINGGYNHAKNIELTKIGASQVVRWRYGYGQARMNYKGLSVNAFLNLSDSGDSFLLRDGRSLIDKSRLSAYQVQHTATLGDRQKFTYGLDAMYTRPVTAASLHGVYEEDDDIDEFGYYIQSESEIFSMLKLILSGRIDYNSRLSAPITSPRSSIIFRPDNDNSFRLTFSRAFSTPLSEHLFMDRVISPMTNHLQPFNIRASGVPETGFTFRQDSNGGVFGLYMQPVSLLRPQSNNNTFLPADATLMWKELVDVVTSVEMPPAFDPFFQALRNAPAPGSDEVQSVLKTFNPTSGKYELLNVDALDPLNSPVNGIGDLEATRVSSFEFGYKGIIGSKLLLNTDVYYSRVKNFIGPLLVETPNVFFERESLIEYLSSLPEFEAAATAWPQRLANILTGIPVGTITPNETAHSGDVLLTYRNFGDIDLVGTDFEFTYLANSHFSFTGSYSYVNKDFFREVGGVRDIALNAPKNKFSIGLHFKNASNGLSSAIKYRCLDGFPVNSGVFVGTVQPFGVLDFNTGIDLPGESGIRVTLTVQNALDNRHREYVGAPEIGRLAHLQFKFFLDKYK